MGVDLQTYRAKIGTFRHSVGLDVITIVCCVNFSGGLKSVGTVLFIGILLLIAGIEPNPGPKEDASEKEEDAQNFSAITVSNLPQQIDDSFLKVFFENKTKFGGRTVKRIIMKTAKQTAIVLFQDSKDAEVVLEKQPIFILRKEVQIALCSESDIEKLKQIKVTELPDNTDEAKLKTFVEDTTQGKVIEIRFDKQNKTADIKFEKLEAVETILDKLPITFLDKRISVSILNEDDERDNVEENKITVTDLPDEMDEETLGIVFENLGDGRVVKVTLAGESNSATIEFQEFEAVQTVLSKRPIKVLGKLISIKLPPNVTEETDRTEILTQMVQKLGLDQFSVKKLTLIDVLSIDPYESERNANHTWKELPLLFLKQLFSANSDSLDFRIYKLDLAIGNTKHKPSKSTAGSVTAMYENDNESETISPLDLLILIFQSSDPEVRQIIVQKLYLCKLAIPFLYHDFFSNKTIVSMWPLRTLIIENQTTQNGQENGVTESEVLEMPTKVVTFGRYGRPLCSKSKFLNGILTDFNADIFFNNECHLGFTQKIAAEGYAEIFWLPASGDETSIFAGPITFINLRGDIACKFFEQQNSFISTLSDVFVIFVDVSSILISADHMRQILKTFKVVVMIISSPLDPRDQRVRNALEKFENSVKSNYETEIHLLCSYCGTKEKNSKQFCIEISKQISECLESPSKFTTKTLNGLFCNSKFNIDTDENEECKHAHDKAKALLETMKDASSHEQWAKEITPVQFIYSKQLGSLLKQMHSKKEQLGMYEEIKQTINAIKVQQTENVTKSVRQFIQCLEESKHSIHCLHYFLVWLKTFLERERRIAAINLNKEHRSLWNIYNALKRDEKTPESEIKKYERKIQESEIRLEEASFAVACYFREISHVYDAFISLNRNPASIGLPSVNTMANISAQLFLNGHTFELLDGNSLFMTTEWNKTSLQIVHEQIKKKKTLALSILGLQSSGKSTLLNTMFGIQFTASAGRCTRGIHAQMVPLDLKGYPHELRKFEYVLVIDTEGLRAPELKENSYKRDNELATIITGLGDITVLNVMGENTTEIRDVLQTIVHAFLRLNLANPKVDIKKSCLFIHQNVTEVSASEKMQAGLQVCVEVLDTVSKESAESEGISNITRFDQVIKFNPEKDVWYLPNLWKGNPPMAQVNRKYSERVVQINHELIRRSLNDSLKSFKSVEDIAYYVDDLWKGVLAENFVFSFRNSIEKKAFVALEKKVKEAFRGLETSVDEKLLALCNTKFPKCKTEETLLTEKGAVLSEILQFITNRENSLTKCMEDYFNDNDYKDITIQWKEKTRNQVRSFASDIYKNKQRELDILLKKRACDILTESKNGKHEDALRKKSYDLASRLKNQNLSQAEIDSEFEKIWHSFVQNVVESTEDDPRLSLRQSFINRLNTIFGSHPVLIKILNVEKYLEKRATVNKVGGSFDKTGISADDVSLKLSFNQQSTMTLKEYAECAVEKVKLELENVFIIVDESIADLNQRENEITDADIGKFLYDAYGLIDTSTKLSSEHFTVKINLHIKALVFVSKVALPLFETHNNEYQMKHGVKTILNSYKNECRESFDAHLTDCKNEETAAIVFRHEVVSWIRDMVSNCMPMKAKQFLKQHLPKSKLHLIIDMLTDLVANKSFGTFFLYIRYSKLCAYVRVRNESVTLLFAGGSSEFYRIAKTEIQLYVNNLREAIKETTIHFTNQPDKPNIDTWLEFLNKKLQNCKLPQECLRRIKLEFRDCQPVNVDSFKTRLLEEIDQVGNILNFEFRSTSASSVKWGIDPYEEVFRDIWGCDEECVFCGEPCIHNTQNHPDDHKCLQHRPGGLFGAHSGPSKEIWLSTCNSDVYNNVNSTCSIFKFACNVGKQESCREGTHPFRQYKTYYPKWDIEPEQDAVEKSKFWMWFVGEYKDQLKNVYNYNITNVNFKIDESDAISSLKKMYFWNE